MVEPSLCPENRDHYTATLRDRKELDGGVSSKRHRWFERVSPRGTGSAVAVPGLDEE